MRKYQGTVINSLKEIRKKNCIYELRRGPYKLNYSKNLKIIFCK